MAGSAELRSSALASGTMKLSMLLFLVTTSLIKCAVGETRFLKTRDGEKHGRRREREKLRPEELKKLPLKERKEKVKEALKEGTIRKDPMKRRKPVRTVANRLKTRARGFKRVKRTDGLSAILFPGVSPEEFYDGEEIPIWMDWVNSEKAQIPYGYYDLPVCPGPSVLQTERLRKNLGAKLQGHRMKPSPFRIFALQDMPCTPICSVRFDTKQLNRMRKMVDRRYRVHAIMDSLPVRMGAETTFAIRGYALGFKAPPSITGRKKDEYFFYNHIKFLIQYREDPENFEGIRIVGFEALPVSIVHQIEGAEHPIGPGTHLQTCNEEAIVENEKDTLLALVPESNGYKEVVYSYEVQWIPSETHWSNRWDIYMVGSPDDKIHYFSIMNSLMVVFILSVIVATVMVRTLRKDIKYYNEQFDLGEEMLEEETGWKLMHGDVFRPPSRFPALFCIAVGTGAQIATVIVLTIAAAVGGFLSPMAKGQTLTAFIVLYVLSSGVAGFWSSRMFKFFDDSKWKINTIIVAAAFPGLLVSMFLVLNVALSFARASSAVSFLTIISLFLLWVCVSTPLAFVGSYFGYKAQKIEIPVKTKQIARAIPSTVAWYLKPPSSCVIGGFLPFGSAILEIFFIMSALWLHQIYYVMGFLLIVVGIVAATCAQVSIVFCYLQLCAEDHQWWWRSFMNSATAGFYLMAYSIWFASSKLQLVGFLPALVYLTYMSMISLAFGLFCGSIGFLCTLYFVRKIYGAVKVD